MEGSCECCNEPSGSLKYWEAHEWLHNFQLLKKRSAPWGWVPTYIPVLVPPAHRSNTSVWRTWHTRTKPTSTAALCCRVREMNGMTSNIQEQFTICLCSCGPVWGEKEHALWSSASCDTFPSNVLRNDIVLWAEMEGEEENEGKEIEIGEIKWEMRSKGRKKRW
jgi:hypothetical protein